MLSHLPFLAALVAIAAASDSMCAYECSEHGSSSVALVADGIVDPLDCPASPYPSCPGAYIEHAEAWGCTMLNGTIEQGLEDCNTYKDAVNNVTEELSRARKRRQRLGAGNYPLHPLGYDEFADIDFFLTRFNITSRLLAWGISTAFRKSTCGFEELPEVSRLTSDPSSNATFVVGADDSITFDDVLHWLDTQGKKCIEGLGAKALCTFLTAEISFVPYVMFFCEQTVLSILGLPVVNTLIEGAGKVIVNTVKAVASTVGTVVRSIFCFGFCDIRDRIAGRPHPRHIEYVK